MRLTGRETPGMALRIISDDNPEVVEILHNVLKMDFAQMTHIFLNLDDLGIYGVDILKIWNECDSDLETFQAKLLDGFCMPNTFGDIKHCAECGKEIKDCEIYQIAIPQNNRRLIARCDSLKCLKKYVEKINA